MTTRGTDARIGGVQRPMEDGVHGGRESKQSRPAAGGGGGGGGGGGYDPYAAGHGYGGAYDGCACH